VYRGVEVELHRCRKSKGANGVRNFMSDRFKIRKSVHGTLAIRGWMSPKLKQHSATLKRRNQRCDWNIAWLSLFIHSSTTRKQHSTDQTFCRSLLRLKAKPDKVLHLRCIHQTRTIVKRAQSSICWTQVGNPVEKDRTTERCNHFLKSERDREQATHVEVGHDTDSI
jgi:hypothetical protein